MKNPFKDVRKKTRKVLANKYTKIVVVGTVSTAAGITAVVGCSGLISRVTSNIAVRFLTDLYAYTLAAKIAEEVVSNELDVIQQNERLAEMNPRLQRFMNSEAKYYEEM